MSKLKFTHVAYVDGDDRCYIRFTSAGREVPGQQSAWHVFKDKLKRNNLFAQWDSKFKFNDGKTGAWYVSKRFLEWNKHEFTNYEEAIHKAEVHEDPVRAWAKQAMQDMHRLFIGVCPQLEQKVGIGI